MKTHWMDRANMTCHLCGKVSRSPLEEARHRHNAPILCKSSGKKLKKTNSQAETTSGSVR